MVTNKEENEQQSRILDGLSNQIALLLRGASLFAFISTAVLVLYAFSSAIAGERTLAYTCLAFGLLSGYMYAHTDQMSKRLMATGDSQ